MWRTYLKSKLHLARITEANAAYEGSVTIDQALLEAADIAAYEQVHLWDVTNGQRLVTYALPGRPGSGVVCVNGAGARLMHAGDRVIIASFVQLTPEAAKVHTPRQFILDDTNQIVRDGGRY